jgi:uncharacterized protein
MTSPGSFPPEVAARLGTYVYRLIDPRSGETFYVGKGRGNRVFAHIRAEEASTGTSSTTSSRGSARSGCPGWRWAT